MMPRGSAMKFAIVLWLFAFMSGALGPDAASGDSIQAVPRSWGQPSLGLRSSISVIKANLTKGEPFVVSLTIENVSGAKIDMKATSAFHLWSPSKTSVDWTLAGGYWCPVNPSERDPDKPQGSIIASPSRLILEKGASLSTIMNLTRHGWEEVTSSWWPVRDFDAVVGSGKYRLRLDIQTGSGEAPQWIRSNEIDVTIGNRK